MFKWAHYPIPVAHIVSFRLSQKYLICSAYCIHITKQVNPTQPKYESGQNFTLQVGVLFGSPLSWIWVLVFSSPKFHSYSIHSNQGLKVDGG